MSSNSAGSRGALHVSMPEFWVVLTPTHFSGRFISSKTLGDQKF